jgi:hypothetical protein
MAVTPNSIVTPQSINTTSTPVLMGTVNGAVNSNFQATVSNAALTSNVATITTSATNGFVTGQFVQLYSLNVATALNSAAGQAPFGPITVTSNTTFTFNFTNANISSAANTGTVCVAQPLVAAGTNGTLVFGINAATNDTSTNNVQLYTSNCALGNNNYTATATAAGTTTLTVTSTFQQYFTGSTTQTVLMPVTSTLTLGQQFQVINLSTGTVTVQSSGANTIQAQAANTVGLYTCILTSGTTAASWSVIYYPTGIAPLATIAVATNSGTNGSTAAVNLIQTGLIPGLKLDSAGNYYFELQNGYTLMANTLAIVTAGKLCTLIPLAVENL